MTSSSKIFTKWRKRQVISALKMTKAKEKLGEEGPLSLWDIASSNCHQVGYSQVKWIALGEYFSHEQSEYQDEVVKDG